MWYHKLRAVDRYLRATVPFPNAREYIRRRPRPVRVHETLDLYRPRPGGHVESIRNREDGPLYIAS